MEKGVTYASLRDDIRQFIAQKGTVQGLTLILSMLYCASWDATNEEERKASKNLEGDSHG